jgi:spore coat polysaccharide biosynthesis protein SpsF (cytidylyltransferase family)
MRVRVVIQARMGSSRLPGKIMAPLAGRPLLAHVVSRLRAMEHEIVCEPIEMAVATTCDRRDDRTEALCRELKVRCLRGPSEDVLARYLAAAADLNDGDVLLRATADNPLYCARRAVAILRQHLTKGSDYTCITGLSYVVPEVMQVGALRRMARLVERLPPDETRCETPLPSGERSGEGQSCGRPPLTPTLSPEGRGSYETAAKDANYCREHVTPYFRRPRAAFRIEQLPADWQGLRSDVRLTVDTPAEYEVIAEIFRALEGKHKMTLEDVYGIWDELGRSHNEAICRSTVASF